MIDVVDIPMQTEEPKKSRGWPKGKPRGSRTKKETPAGDFYNPAVQEQLHAVVVMAVGVASLLIAEEIRATPEEINLIFAPLERIYLRRFHMSDKITPDMMDGLQAFSGMVMYGYRVFSYTQAQRALRNVGDGASQATDVKPPAGAAPVPGSNGVDGSGSWLADYHSTHSQPSRNGAHEVYDGAHAGVGTH